MREEDWNKINFPNLKDPKLKSVKLKLDAIVSKATNVIDKIEEFNFEEFESEFFESTEYQKNNSFTKLFQEYVSELKVEERLGTASTYNTTL